MCVAIPVKIKSKISKSKFQIEDGKKIDISLIPDAKVGDWILCHADLAVSKIPASDAKQILELNKSCEHNH